MEIVILNQTRTLEQGITTVGRSSEADITVEAPTLSSVHARFILTGTTFEVEDLGSEQGTTVNGRPVRGRYGLIRGDRLLFGDVPCTVQFPKEGAVPAAVPAAAAPRPAPASRPRVKASPELQVKGYKRQETAIIKRIVGLAIGIIIAAVIYSFVISYVPADLARAREELASAETAIAVFTEKGGPPGETELVAELNGLKVRLGELATGFPSEKARAVAIIDTIDVHLRKIAAGQADHDREDAAAANLDKIEADLAAGRIAATEAIILLQHMDAVSSGTAAAAQAAERARVLDRELVTAEKELIARTREEALNLTADRRFSEAFTAIDACLSRSFQRLEPADLEPLKGTREVVNIKAAAWFQEAVDRALDQSAERDREQVIRELRSLRASAGPADLDAILDEAVRKLGKQP